MSPKENERSSLWPVWKHGHSNCPLMSQFLTDRPMHDAAPLTFLLLSLRAQAPLLTGAERFGAIGLAGIARSSISSLKSSRSRSGSRSLSNRMCAGLPKPSATARRRASIA